jgi:hypothetical protein
MFMERCGVPFWTKPKENSDVEINCVSSEGASSPM